MNERCRVGTASWADPEFVRDWYPRGLPARERLGYYSGFFDLVEVDSTFYSVPLARLTVEWARATPDGFLFDIKLHRLLSRHRCEPKFLPRELQSQARTRPDGSVVVTPELQDAVLSAVLKGIAPLEDAGKLGALLLQLGPAFSPQTVTIEAIEPLLERLRPHSVAVELRNRDWVEGAAATRTHSYFEERGVTLVSVDGPDSKARIVMPRTDTVTNPRLAYLRLHGRNTHAFLTGKTVAERLDYNYSDAELYEVKRRVQALAALAGAVHAIFNNNRSNYAPSAARRLRQFLGQTGSSWPKNPTYTQADLFA